MRRVQRITRRPCPYRSSYPIEEIDVRFEDGVTLELMLKVLSSEALSGEARRARPAFLLSPTREIDVYLSVLDTARWGTAGENGEHGQVICDGRLRRGWSFLVDAGADRVAARELTTRAGRASEVLDRAV